MVRTNTGMCWIALCNTRTEPSDQINAALDQMLWNMVRTVHNTLRDRSLGEKAVFPQVTAQCLP
jgi:hypothetical protein